MKLSPQQEEALSAVANWLHVGDPAKQVFRLFGFAGSGKTTLARQFTEGVEPPVLFAAYTGKAALVMNQKGCPGTSTIHRLIYNPREKSKLALLSLEQDLVAEQDEDRRREITAEIALERANIARPSFTLNRDSELKDATLLVVDEVSMVGSRIGADLLSFGTPVLALGDPAQLPPVADAGFFTNEAPDFMLTEIHRQAQGSPVLQLATKVREREWVEYGDYGTSRVVQTGVLDIEELLAFDQVICGRNRTRHKLNAMMRKALGMQGALPMRGDKLVCLRNDYEEGLLNGGQWEVLSSKIIDDNRLELLITDALSGMEPPEFPLVLEVEAHRHYFEGREKELRPYEVRDAQCFDYGYALTCHKAQGSQWGKVMVRDESSAFGADAHRWLYTAVTRAADEVVIVR